MMKRIAFTGAVLLSSLLSVNLMAAEMSPAEKAGADAATRQAVFKLLSFSNGPLGGMARGAPYDAAVAKTSAERILMLSKLIPEVFASDTSSFKDIKTRASDTIWKNKADFDKLAADLGAGATSALEILASKGADGVKDAVGAIGPKCGACHDHYRLK